MPAVFNKPSRRSTSPCSAPDNHTPGLALLLAPYLYYPLICHSTGHPGESSQLPPYTNAATSPSTLSPAITPRPSQSAADSSSPRAVKSRRTRVRSRSSPIPSLSMSALASTSSLPPTPGSPPPYSATPPAASTSHANSATSAPRAASSPHLHSSHLHSPFRFFAPSSSSRPASSSASLSRRPSTSPNTPYFYTDTEDDREDTGAEDNELLYTASGVTARLHARIVRKANSHPDPRPITTTSDIDGAGETETEGEELCHHLPTARLVSPSSIPLSPLDHLLSFLALLSPAIPLLFELSRLLSVVPAVFGTLYNFYYIIHAPSAGARLDFFVSALWSILTGWQCLQLTSGLLKRWRVYYSPFPTLIRLLALQAICWPATHFTLSVLDHSIRPVICWAVVGTTTCCSRSIQIWVTSNIVSPRTAAHRRRWDWGVVGVRCALPAGIVYFIMAWTEVLRREFERC